MVLLYQAGVAKRLVGYMDVDWAGNANDGRSSFGDRVEQQEIIDSNTVEHRG